MRTFCPPSSSLCSEVTVLTGLQEPVILWSDHSVIIIIVTIVIITFSRLLSLFRVLTTRVVSVITDIVTIIADNQPCMVLLVRALLASADISVLCQFYCSHRNERSPVLTAWPALSPQTHMGEPVTADFLWSELCQGRGQQTNRLGGWDIHSHHWRLVLIRMKPTLY